MTGEHPIAVAERSTVAIELKLLVALVVGLVVLAASGGVAWAALRGSVADDQARIGTLEVRTERLEVGRTDQQLQLQRLTDDVEHIRETVDQTAKDVKELQRRAGR